MEDTFVDVWWNNQLILRNGNCETAGAIAQPIPDAALYVRG